MAAVCQDTQANVLSTNEIQMSSTLTPRAISVALHVVAADCGQAQRFLEQHDGGERDADEDEEIFVHPRDPYKRVDALPSSRQVRVSVGGVVVAETRRPVLLFETRLPIRYYIPPEDVRFDRLTAVPLWTSCPYRGKAHYWSTSDADNVTWAYADPIPAAEPIKDHVAFYNEIVDIEVDGELLERPVTPFTARLKAG